MSDLSDLAIILVAAGASTRMGFDKIWAVFDGEPLLLRSVRAVSRLGAGEVVVVVHPDREDHARVALGPGVIVVAGGARRRDSVAAGVQACARQWVGIHDAARALVPGHLFADGLAAARPSGAAVPVLPVKDTIKRVQEGRVRETLPRAELMAVQTPQVFRRDLLMRALASTDADVTDEAALLERTGAAIATFPGAESNFKITTPFDFQFALRLVGQGLARP